MKKTERIAKLFSHPKDLTYQQVDNLLKSLGHIKINSRGAKMVYEKRNKKLSFHIPHRYETFQAYQVTQLLKDLGEDLYT